MANKKNSVTTYRQGDVLLIRVDGDIESLRGAFTNPAAFERASALFSGYKAGKLNKRKDVMLAEGEATGHHHVFETGSDVEVYEQETSEKMSVNEKGQIVVIGENANLIHTSGPNPDHAPMVIPEGTYIRTIQKTNDPFTGWRAVRD